MDSRTQLTSMAIEELDKGDFLMATKILTSSIRLEPNNHELYFERSICNHKLANYQASLEDANAAIRLNSSDYNIHYQRGLALIGLSMFPEAVTSFKKAIELRAKQDDSKLSDIFKLLRDATNELNTARRRPGAATNQVRTDTPATNINANSNTINNNITVNNNDTGKTSSANHPSLISPIRDPVDRLKSNCNPKSDSDPVDSTTDQPNELINFVTSADHAASSSVLPPAINHKNDSSNLVASSVRNSNQKQCANQLTTTNTNPVGIGSSSATMATTTATSITNRVSSSAIQFNQNQRTGDYNSNLADNKPRDNSITINHNDATTNDQHRHQHMNDSMREPPLSASPFEWNIRRSERIFLHNSSEPGTSGPSDDMTGQQNRVKSGSNPSSINSGKGVNKRSFVEQSTIETKHYKSSNEGNGVYVKQRNGTNSAVDSEIEVDDNNHFTSSHYELDSNPSHKRVMVTPSSSMPATGQSTAPVSTKEDSYSSKYKRLRRDRERARRGTSKLCTIKPSDLDDLNKLSNSNSEKRFMRVIAPIDGWLYSGQLSIDDNHQQNEGGALQYVVKLDGDSSESNYLFSQETVLNDVIKEVRVKSVSELRKGARICCYWSRTYKCLSTGVVTSRTFEATKSLVSVKYDNGDLSALPLEDLRLLPPDYPKYMSNCDPLLLAKNGDHADVTSPIANTKPNSSRVVVDYKSSNFGSCATYSKAVRNSMVREDGQMEEQNRQTDSLTPEEPTQPTQLPPPESNPTISSASIQDDAANHHDSNEDLSFRSALDDETIPPTSETIDFITGETNLDVHDEQMPEQIVARLNKNDILLTNEPQLDNSRASSEENNYGVEYRPWSFEGPPKRSKRNGRTYRDTYSAIRRGNEVLKVGDSAELMPRDESILPFIAKIDGLWATSRGEMRVRVRWYYRLIETEGANHGLEDGDNALFETDHFDENDVQSIWRTTKILSWTDYSKDHMRHVNKPSDGPKIFYLAGYYDPVRRIKHLRSDVKNIQ